MSNANLSDSRSSLHSSVESLESVKSTNDELPLFIPDFDNAPLKLVGLAQNLLVDNML